MLKNSKIYVGKVIHRRFKPKNHNFKYRVFSLLIDLDDLNEIDNNPLYENLPKSNCLSSIYGDLHFKTFAFLFSFSS